MENQKQSKTAFVLEGGAMRGLYSAGVFDTFAQNKISTDGIYYQTKYRDLLNDEDAVTDNAGLMAIKFLAFQNVSSINLVGFDGYSHDVRENYGTSEMAFISRNAVLDAMNVGMSKVLKSYSKIVNIKFLTTPKHVNF